MVNLSFSFRTPSTSSYLLVGVKEREDRRRQKTTNRGNKDTIGFCLRPLSACISEVKETNQSFERIMAMVFKEKKIMKPLNSLSSTD